MPEFPISIRSAAKELGISPNEASIIVRVLEIPTEPYGVAFMMDAEGFADLEVAAARLRPGYEPPTPKPPRAKVVSRTIADARLLLAKLEQGEVRSRLSEIITELESKLRR